jgi:hypothetical protein
MSKLLNGLAASALLLVIALPGSADAAQRAEGLSNAGDYEVSAQYRRRYVRPYYPRRYYARRYYAPYRYYPRRYYARRYYAPYRYYPRRYYAAPYFWVAPWPFWFGY